MSVKSTSAPLLTTKLTIPPTRPERVVRSRLIEMLDAALGRRLILVAAPAGFGKTTLVSAWLQQLAESTRVSWLSLDSVDDDLFRFLSYFIAAVQQAVDLQGQASLNFLDPTRIQPGVVMEALINDLAASAAEMVLVLDDYHLVEKRTIHESLDFFLDRAPVGVSLVLISRADPPLHLSRLRARKQLAEVRASDLRFTAGEAALFLEGETGISFSAEDAAAIEKRTEGWIAGLQLAAITLQDHLPPPDSGLTGDTTGKVTADVVGKFIAAFTGDDRYVGDYLVEEVLEQRPEGTRAFLLQTSILSRLTASLCNAITGRDDSGVVLAELEQANLFITPLDSRRRWYRYHQLFVDLLRRHLDGELPGLAPLLHLRASRWFEEQKLYDEAVGHALSAGDPDRAASLVEDYARAVIMLGRSATVRRWLEALPDDLVRSRPRLGLVQAVALTFVGDIDGVEARLDDLETAVEESRASLEERDYLLGAAAAYRAMVAFWRRDSALTIRRCHEALERLPVDESYERGLAKMLLGMTCLHTGRLKEAREHLVEAQRAGELAGDLMLVYRSTIGLGEVAEVKGELKRAAEIYRQALDLATAPGGGHYPVAGSALVALAGLYYLWNELLQADQCLTEAFSLSELGGLDNVLRDTWMTQAGVRRAQGDWSGALEALDMAERLARGRQSQVEQERVAAYRVDLWLAMGRLDEAAGYANDAKSSVGDQAIVWPESRRLALARVLIALGREYGDRVPAQQARELLEPLATAAEETDRWGSLITILVLQALAADAQQELIPALSYLERAVTLAEPDGAIRYFADEGKPLAKLLLHLLRKSQGPATEFLTRALAAITDEASSAPPTPSGKRPLVEPLSERELEVLRLINAGLSNQEIADELTIALSTVKKHINHIYGKLEVDSRTRAIARGRELMLI